MQEIPEISVIIPFLQRHKVSERYLQESVTSILAQTSPEFEIIIVADCSTEVAERLRKNFTDLRVRILFPVRERGVSQTRNAGIAASRGRYIALQDDDDVCCPERLSKQYQVLERQPDVAMVGTGVVRIDASGQPLGIRFACPHPTLRTLRKFNQLFTCSIMFRKNIFDNLGGYDPRFKISEDHDLTLRFAAHYQIAIIPHPLQQHRIYPLSHSGKSPVETKCWEFLAVLKSKGMLDPLFLTALSDGNPEELLSMLKAKDRGHIFICAAFDYLQLGDMITARDYILLGFKEYPLSHEIIPFFLLSLLDRRNFERTMSVYTHIRSWL